jgi:hypothetical protein
MDVHGTGQRDCLEGCERRRRRMILNKNSATICRLLKREENV